MTCGIYLLNFKGTDKVYVGQSIHIEDRYTNHLWKLSRNEASQKLQNAYVQLGTPSLSIIKECDEKDLNMYEIYYINEFDSLQNGLNSSKGGEEGPYIEGLDNPNSIYNEEQLFNVLYFLSEPVYSINEIVDLTGVSERAIQNIASLKSHKWMKQKWPELYSKLEVLKLNNRHSIHLSMYRNNVIVSPEGKEYIVDNPTNFCKEFGLNSACIRQVLHGGKQTYKGWHLPSYEKPMEYYPEIMSPDNIIYVIKYMGAQEFAKEHNLDPSALRHVLRGTAKSHKGWKLVKEIIDLKTPII